MIVLHIFLGLIVLDLMVIAHELGHYITARLFDVEIKEFAIGMGPKIISKTSKKTGIAYSLRAFPIGGFVAMVGEEEDTENPRALNKKKWWQRLIIDLAGITMNLILGVLLMTIFVSSSIYSYPTTTIGHLTEYEMEYVRDSDNEIVRDGEGKAQIQEKLDKEGNKIKNPSYAAGLREGDKIIRVDGKRCYIGPDVVYFISMRGIKPIDIEVERDGRLISFTVTYATETTEGLETASADFNPMGAKFTLGRLISHSFHMTKWGVRMVWDSLTGLITGRFSFKQMSGPIGVTQQIGQTATSDGLRGFIIMLELCAVITINFAIFNLLPFPALDGGHAVMRVVEGITKKKVPAKVEQVLNLVGLGLLFALAIFATFQDIFRLSR